MMDILKISIFLECHTRIFNDKMSEINENFYVNNVQNCDSVYMYRYFKYK